MEQGSTKTFNEIDELLKTSDNLLKETEEMNKCIEFLCKEYDENPGYFNNGEVGLSIKDIIKTSFEFGWMSRGNFNCNKK